MIHPDLPFAAYARPQRPRVDWLSIVLVLVAVALVWAFVPAVP